MRFINFNGSIQSENVPLIHSWNRSFRYGDGLFESIAIVKSQIPFLDDHWGRLAGGAKLLSLELSPDLSKEFLRKSILELLSLNSIKDNAYARVHLYREGKGRYNPTGMLAGYLIEVEPVSDLFSLNGKGLTIGIFTGATKSIDDLSNYKTCSALTYVLASIHKTKSGWDDCLILNSRSNICESTNSNVFFLKNKFLLTPSLAEGCVNGVMRRQVISIAGMSGLQVEETVIETEALSEADEIFLTNAVSGIRWVQSYGNSKYGNEISSGLSEELKKLVS